MIDIIKLTKLSFWFAMRPAPMSKEFTIAAAVFFGLFIAAKIVLRIIMEKQKKLMTAADKKLSNMIQSFCLTMGSLGLLWTFFAYEGLPILASRYWVLLWLLGAIIWAYFIVRYYALEYTDFKERLTAREKLEKYLPRRSQT